MQGQIIKIVSDLHIVSCNGETYPCKCRGIFRKEHITPLVGDYVLFSKEKNLIESIMPRKNEFQRPKVSNIDQAFLITSLVHPDFSLNLLDKLIVLMEINKVEPIICITKEDITEVLNTYFNEYYNEADDKDTWFNNMKEMAEKLGYCTNMKEYKENPDNYKGSIADVSNIIRVGVTTKSQTPDLYIILKLLGSERIKNRINSL